MSFGNDPEWQELLPHLLPGDGVTEKQAQANRMHAARQSFRWFFYIYLGHHLTIQPAPFQLEEFELAREERLLVVQPRGYGKSVKWSIGYPLWVMLCNPYEKDMKWQKEDLILLSNTSSLAEKWIRAHKRELMENKRIQHDFRPSEGKIWRNDEIEVVVDGRPHGRILARGSGAQIRGEHPTEILIDDLENREEAASEGPREKMREYFYQDLWGAVRQEEGSRTRVKIVGTFVHPLALLPELYEHDWWEKRKHAVYKPDGSPLWPEYMDDEALQDLRKTIPETAWMSEYMNSPIVSENPTFMRETFRAYEPGMIRGTDGKKISFRDMYVVTAIDPAISQRDGADYTAITTYGAIWDEKEPRIYCLDARRGHWSTSKQITELMACYERFPGSVQLIETVAYQKALFYEYKERLDRERLNIKVLEVIPDKDKGRRANAVTPMFERGWVYFDMGDRNQQQLMDELALFDYTRKRHGRDDYVDATVMCLDYIDNLFRRHKNKGRGKKKPIIKSGLHNRMIYGGGVNARG